MFMNKKKNNTTTRLPMTGKVKKGFRFYCSLVAVLTIIAGTCVPAFAATSDPITVVNNLSDFIFGTYPCNRTYHARLRYCAGGSLVEKPRPVSESERLSDPCRRYHHHFRKGNPYPYHRLIENWHRGRIGKTVRPQICIRRCER